MKIRLAKEKDATDVAAIIKRHHQEDYMGYATFDESYIKEKMKKNNFYFVADDGNIVGCLRASVVDLDLAEIRTVCVEEAYRGRGLAKEMAKKALAFLKEKKMRKRKINNERFGARNRGGRVYRLSSVWSTA